MLARKKNVESGKNIGNIGKIFEIQEQYRKYRKLQKYRESGMPANSFRDIFKDFGKILVTLSDI